MQSNVNKTKEGRKWASEKKDQILGFIKKENERSNLKTEIIGLHA